MKYLELTDKETYLSCLMLSSERQVERDSLLINFLPGLARRVIRIRTIK